MTVERAVPGEAIWGELSAPHLARYLAAADYAKGRRVLDAGSGAGYGASMLKEAGALTVQGVDLDVEAVALAKERFSAPGVEFQVDDCEVLVTVESPIDLICCFEAIEHLKNPSRFLRRASELLQPGGVLFVSTPDRAVSPAFVNGRPRNPYHENEWTLAEFESLLTPHFSDVEMRVQVESVALRTRLEAVAALRQGLTWNNPLATLLWRKWPARQKSDRAWKKLAGLAAPNVSDYPIVPRRLATAYGTPWFHFAICRNRS